MCSVVAQWVLQCLVVVLVLMGVTIDGMIVEASDRGYDMGGYKATIGFGFLFD